MVNVAILGYGRMGRRIEELCPEYGVNVVSTIDPVAPGARHTELNEDSLSGAQVVIDFSHPGAIHNNVVTCARHGVNHVLGTTGWYDTMADVQHHVENAGTGVIWSGNFSLGVNMFFRIVRAAASVVNTVDGYDTFAYEMHHNNKADSPSGTARMLADILVDELNEKSSAVYDKLDRQIQPDEVHVASVRGGSVAGTHVICFDSLADSIELKHSARNRDGFARGAILAARWVAGRQGFYSIDAMMDELIGGN